jgi:tRNA pseudouridine55 synthase
MSWNNIIDPDSSKQGEILFIDKPLDCTSFDVVKKIKYLLSVKKVGHAGTLDPKATGLLILCTGNKTKNINQYSDLEKEYKGTFQLGITTPSYDTETEICDRKDCSLVTRQQVNDVAIKYEGKQLQTPPMYSAVKYCGRPLYKYARENKTVVRSEREIEIKKFEILDFHNPFVDFSVVCSKGTYIRSLINDFGGHIGCGATLISLRRTRIGNYDVSSAVTVQQLVDDRKKIFNRDQILDEACSAN